MLIPLVLISVAALLWLVWQWRSGALLADAPTPRSMPVGLELRSANSLGCDSRSATLRTLTVAQRQGLIWQPPSRKAA